MTKPLVLVRRVNSSVVETRERGSFKGGGLLTPNWFEH